MYEVKLDAADVAKTFRILRNVDPNLVKELRSELKSELTPLAKSIAAKYPTQIPDKLYGFQWSYSSWYWGKAVGSVRLTTGRSRKRSGASNLVSLSMGYRSATPYAIDMIGRASTGSTPQARKLYETVNKLFPNWPNGGRVFYKPFKDARPNIAKHAENIINRWSDKVNRELN
jgi:hypothetical protein